MPDETTTNAGNLLSKLSKEEKVIAGCSAFTLLCCVLPWYSVRTPMFSASSNAFDVGFWGVLTFLGALVAGGVLVTVKVGLAQWTEDLAAKITLFSAAASALGTLIYQFQGDNSGDAAEFLEAAGMSAGKTVWPWFALLAMGAAAFYSFKRWQAAQQNTPSGD